MTDTQAHHDPAHPDPEPSLAEQAAAAGPDWKWMAALGAVMILGGFFAFLNPFIASLTATAIAAATFLVAGIMQVWMAFKGTDGSGSRAFSILLGVVLVLFAISLWVNPISGILSLTLLVGVFFLAMGAMRIWIALKMPGREGRGWMIAAGLVSAALGVLVIFAVPAGAVGLLGIFLGVELLSSGAGAVALALAVRRLQ
jgi:uncharacterized membrane protein HdeD (DUF308 family)